MTEAPYTLIAELSYRCPLRCPYCSNPLDYRDTAGELSTEVWQDVFRQAAALGVMQLHLTGGEPLVRRDLEELVQSAHGLGLYVNLVTSAIPLSRDRLVRLRDAGVDCVQVSIQDAFAESANAIAGFSGFNEKLEAMAWVKELGLPLTMNVVLHRANLEHVPEIIALAERVGADRLELANTQYLGWALENRQALMPSREQLMHAHGLAIEAKARLTGQMEILFVMPDYFSRYPRSCMDGWARRFLHVTPDGTALPCHAAASIPQLSFERVTERSLAFLWYESHAFNAYRGDHWMKEPCSSCERRTVDFAGCRCQAFALTGDPTATDPACSLAPSHEIVVKGRIGGPERRYLHRGSKSR